MEAVISEAEYHALLDFLPESIFLIDSSATVLYANRSVNTLVGFESTNLIGSSITELVHPTSRPDLRSLLVALGNKGTVRSPLRLQLKDSRTKSVECVGGTVSEGVYHLILREETAKMRKEEDLQRRNREIVALYQIGREITSTFNVDHLLSTVVANIFWVLECHVAGVAIHDPQTGSVSWRNVLGNRTKAFPESRDGHKFVAQTMSARVRMIIEGIPDDPTLDPHDRELFSAEGLKSVLGVPLLHKDEVFGIIMVGYREHHVFAENEIRLSINLAAQTALALENARLYQSSLDHSRNLEALSAKLSHVQEEERMRISSDLHEGLGQVLSGIRLHLEAMKKDGLLNKEAGEQRLAMIHDTIDEALGAIREMTFTLRPRVLDELGLVSALRVLLQRFSDKSGIDVVFDVPNGLGRWSGEIEGMLYRVMQEALDNVEHHSGASSVTIAFVPRGADVEISVSDNGRGFDVASVGGDLRVKHALGVFSMSERIREMNGGFTITSSIGRGTTIHITMPTP